MIAFVWKVIDDTKKTVNKTSSNLVQVRCQHEKLGPCSILKDGYRN